MYTTFLFLFLSRHAPFSPKNKTSKLEPVAQYTKQKCLSFFLIGNEKIIVLHDSIILMLIHHN